MELVKAGTCREWFVEAVQEDYNAREVVELAFANKVDELAQFEEH